jgi:subtilisin family serine protease
MAVRAGIVVVTSAGNYGAKTNGDPVYGGVSTPGIEPSVITVGAMTTWGTSSRSDDRPASYTGKGPTIDGLIKPDIAAAGSRIVAPMNSTTRLSTAYPQIRVNSDYARMSGTSMSAPVVAGAAALILQKRPQLTPNAVKAILMYTAESRWNPLEVGAGYINIAGAMDHRSFGSRISTPAC